MSTEILDGKKLESDNVEPLENGDGGEKVEAQSASWWKKQLELSNEEQAESWDQAAKAWDEYSFAEARKASFQRKHANSQHFPMFWANVNILSPNVYNYVPDPIVKRRNSDEDDISRVAGLIGERLAFYLIDETPFHKILKQATLNLLVGGRAVAKVFHERKEGQPSKTYLQMDQVPPQLEGQVQQDEIGIFIIEPDPAPETESVVPQLVRSSDYRCTPGVASHSDVWWISFDAYMDREDFEERFGKQIKEKGINISEVPFNYDSKRAKQDSEHDHDDSGDYGKFCKVTEIWNKRKRLTLWIVEDADLPILDEAEDLHELRKFFPSPCPAQIQSTEDSIHPIPDFIQYQQSLSVIDFLENRKWRLIKALRPHGVYDGSQKELSRLRSEAEDADLIPVKNMTELMEKGGLEAVIQYADKSSLIQALASTYESIEQEKQKIYEITGTSDIIRGASEASESATAQSIKNDSFNTRLNDRREAIASFARELLELMLELALSTFHDQTIAAICGIQSFTPEDRQVYPMALSLLRNDRFRTFKLEIETSSTWASQDQRDKEQSNELIQTLSGLYEQVVNISQVAPELLDSMKEAAMYAVRRLRQATSIEGVIEKGFNALSDRMTQMMAPPDPNAPPPPPDPEIQLQDMKMQLEQTKIDGQMQSEQQRAELEAGKAQAEAEIAERKTNLEIMKLDKQIAHLQLQMQVNVQEAELGAEKAKVDLVLQAVKQEIEQIKSQTALTTAAFELQAKSLTDKVEGAEKEKAARTPAAQPVTVVIEDKGKRVARFVDTPTGRMAISEPLEDEGAI